MKTTIGQLVSELFARYERQYHDEKLAAVATQVVVSELLAAPTREVAAPIRRRPALRQAS